MEEAQYIEDRLDIQIAWYDKKSIQNQRMFKWLKIFEIIAAAMIPFLSGIKDQVWIPYLIGILGVLITIIAGFLFLSRSQELWQEYRTMCESLKHEKYLYLTKCDPYSGDEAFNLFVNTVESLISKEHSRWIEGLRKKIKKEDK